MVEEIKTWNIWTLIQIPTHARTFTSPGMLISVSSKPYNVNCIDSKMINLSSNWISMEKIFSRTKEKKFHFHSFSLLFAGYMLKINEPKIRGFYQRFNFSFVLFWGFIFSLPWLNCVLLFLVCFEQTIMRYKQLRFQILNEISQNSAVTKVKQIEIKSLPCQ